jgi:hypothetical protein
MQDNINSVQSAWWVAPPLSAAIRHVGPPPHASSTWAHHPCPSATWVCHLHPHWTQIIDQKSVEACVRFHLCLYSTFSIFILINTRQYQFSPVSMVGGPTPIGRHSSCGPTTPRLFHLHPHRTQIIDQKKCGSVGLNTRPSRLDT